jgi:hypothetical protein
MVWKMTGSLGAFEEQRMPLRGEIDTITDVEILELLRDASSIREVSDVASQRLRRLDAVIESQSVALSVQQRQVAPVARFTLRNLK